MTRRIRLTPAMRGLLLDMYETGSAYPLDRNHRRTFDALEERDYIEHVSWGTMADHPTGRNDRQTTHRQGKEPLMQVSFTAQSPAHGMLTIQQRLEAAGFTNVHVNAISDTVEPFTRTNRETVQAYDEGKQAILDSMNHFSALNDEIHRNPYRDGDR